MSFLTQLTADYAILTHPAYFGETITYTPKGGAPKSITAQVFRNPVREEPGGGRTFPANAVGLAISNDPTLGVQTVTPRFDRVALRLRPGDAADTTLVVTRAYDTYGGWNLEATA